MKLDKMEEIIQIERKGSYAGRFYNEYQIRI